MTTILTLPAPEVLAGTSRLTALETAHGLDRSPRCSAYCVMRRRAS